MNRPGDRHEKAGRPPHPDDGPSPAPGEITINRVALRSTLSFILALGATSTAAPAADGPAPRPRRELSKLATLERPEYEHRLTVKFRDVLKVRAAAGDATSLAAGDVTGIRTVLQRHGATLEPLIRIAPEKIQLLEQRGAQRSGVAQPDLAGMFIVHVPDHRMAAAANALNALPATEYVTYQHLFPEPPCNDISPTTSLYTGNQGYHSGTSGVNMSATSALGSARGAGIRVSDCEYGYNLTHEDLCNVTLEPGQTIAPGVIANDWDQHGTAVLGEMVSVDNGYGTRGLAPEAEAFFFTEWSAEQGFRRTTAIANAVANSNPGDVVVLEMQTGGANGGFAPAEYSLNVWTIVKNATDNGVIVVAAAGNGNEDLDSPGYQSYRDRGDSGAIIVGAGSSNSTHAKLGFSTYGERVDVQGWGESVMTLGYGGFAAPGGDVDQYYTSSFSGTSSATPIVAGVVLALQSLAVEQCGHRLNPLAMRGLLKETGVPQGGGGGNIGPFPNALEAGLAIVTDGPFEDCNGNTFNDVCDIGSGTSGDCNANGVPDECDISAGSSTDDNMDGIPDECIPPLNDECVDAQPVGAGQTSFSTFTATTDGPADTLCGPAGNNQIDADVWFSYTPTCAGPITVGVCDADFDTRLAVYTNFCPSVLNQAIGCNDDGCGDQSTVSFVASAGTTYLLRVGGYDGAQGTGMLDIDALPCDPPPGNDECGSATTAALGDTAFTTVGATTGSFADVDCGGAAATVTNDVWYRYFTPSAGTLTISVCDSDYGTRLAVYGTGCPSASGQELACDLDSCGTTSEVTMPVAAFELLRIRIGGDGGQTGTGILTIGYDDGPACEGDTDGNDSVDIDDIVNVVLDFGTDGSVNGGDVDGSGVVDIDDVVLVVLNFGPCG